MNITETFKEESLSDIAAKDKFAIVDGPFGTQLHASEYKVEGVPVVRIVNTTYSGQFVIDNLVFISERKAGQLKRSKVVPGDIIVAKTGATIGKSGIFPNNFSHGIIASSCLKLTVDQQIADHRFIGYLIQSREGQNKIIDGAGGSTRTTINTKPFGAIRFCFPTKPEQTKIAEILSTVDRAIEQTEALIAKQQRIKTGLMQDLLTRGIDEHGNLRSEQTHEFKDSPLGRIPVEWEVNRLGSVLVNINQGWSPDCDSEPASIGEWGVLKTTAVVWQGYADNENKSLPEQLKPRYSLEVTEGDLLMTRAGPNSRVGVVAYVYQTRGKLILSDKIYRLVPTEAMDGRFLCYSLSGFESQKHLSNLKTGMAESQTNISQEIVKSLFTVVPKKEEQVKIAELLDNKSNDAKQSFEALEKLRSLKTALMQDLLTGKKRVNALLKETTNL